MQLNRASLIELYKNEDLVCLPFEKIELLNQKPLNIAIKATGQNKKKVLVIVNHSIDDLNSTENTLLFNILKAIHLTIDDIKLVEFTGIPLKFLFKTTAFDKCLIMGLNPSQLALQIAGRPYEVFRFMQSDFLLSHSTNLLNKHKKYKEILWKAIQIMFPPA